MTFHTQAQVAGGEIVRILELVVPRCALRYGNLPCTAGARALAHPNLIQQSEVNSGGVGTWEGGGITPVFSSFIAPNSTMTGVMLTDSHNTNLQFRRYYVSSKDPAFAALTPSAWLDFSTHVLKKSGAESVFAARLTMFDGVSSSDIRLLLDSYTGCWSAADIAGNFPVRAANVVDCGSFWRAQLRVNRASANSVTVQFYPAWNGAGALTLAAFSANVVGSHGIWGAQLYAHNSASAPFAPYLTRGVESQWLSSGLSQACYQTAHTCQDLANYLQGDQSIFFIDEKVDLPPGLSAFPALVGASLNPARINPQMGVGESATLSVELRDFTYNDAGTDPYVDARSYNPNSQGTFFGRLFARDPYIQGKRLRYYEGYYAGSGTFTFSHYLVREFIVDEIDRPDWKGRVKIRGTDILRLTNEDRALCPLPSTATLQGNLTVADSAFFMASSAAAAYLASDAHVRIDSELLQLVTQTGCRWTTVRGAGNSDIAVHSGGSVVQVCQTYSYMNVCSVAMDLLVNRASIPSSYIPVNSWDAEKASSLTDYNLYNIISKPTPVRDLLKEVAQTCDIAIWYEEIASKIALHHQKPWENPSITLSDSGGFLKDSLSIKARDDLKVSRVGVRYAPTNYADAGDFTRFQLAVNSSREDPRFDGRRSEYELETAWLSSSHDALAATLAGRALLRYSDMAPLEASFRVDATTVASVRTGNVVELSTRLLQNVDGTHAGTRMQIIEAGPEMAGHSYRYNALLYQGLAAATSLSIDVSTYNYNVHSAMGGPTSAVRVYLTVNSGIHVGGSGAGQAAITTSGLPAGSIVYLSAIGSSMVLGYAGLGGDGATANLSLEEEGWQLTLIADAEAGDEGGPALYLGNGVTAYIDVSAGYLLAGGPGGGGGGIEWDGGSQKQNGGNGGRGQGFTNSGGPSVPQTTNVVDGGSGAVWGGTAFAGADGNTYPGAAAGPQGYAVKLANASAVYYFVGGYDSTHVKGLVGV